MVLCEYSTEREVVGLGIHTDLTRRPRRETAMSTEFRCEVCDGYGVIGRDVDSPCPRCGGSGLKDSVGSLDSEDQDHLHLDLTLPAGVTQRGRKGIVTLPEGIGDGTVLRLRGLGPSGEARRGDLYLHVRAIAPPAPADATRSPHPIDCEPNVGVAEPQGTSLRALPPVVAAAAPLITEEEAVRAVGAYFSRRSPGQAPIMTFVWRCDHATRSRCSTAAVWHVRANDQVCTVYEDGHVEPTFESLLSPKDVHPPSYEELATLNAELRLKSPEAIARLLDTMEGYATWDAQSRRFVCTDSGWVTTVQALDYYVDDPGLWQQRAEAASKAAIDDEMGEWERALQDTVREHFTALLGAATSGAGSGSAAASSGPSTVQEAPDDVISHSPAS